MQSSFKELNFFPLERTTKKKKIRNTRNEQKWTTEGKARRHDAVTRHTKNKRNNKRTKNGRHECCWTGRRYETNLTAIEQKSTTEQKKRKPKAGRGKRESASKQNSKRVDKHDKLKSGNAEFYARPKRRHVPGGSREDTFDHGVSKRWKVTKQEDEKTKIQEKHFLAKKLTRRTAHRSPGDDLDHSGDTFMV